MNGSDSPDPEIGEGTTASLKFMEAAFGNISDLERQKIRTDLLNILWTGHRRHDRHS